MKKAIICAYCQADTMAQLEIQIFGNGSLNFVWVCDGCRRFNPEGTGTLYIPKETVQQHLTPEQIAALPKIMPALETRCAHCGNRATELHHWAPKAIFGAEEAGRWPMDYLCKTCHDLWHYKVTPQLVKR